MTLLNGKKLNFNKMRNKIEEIKRSILFHAQISETNICYLFIII